MRKVRAGAPGLRPTKEVSVMAWIEDSAEYVQVKRCWGRLLLAFRCERSYATRFLAMIAHKLANERLETR
jgi:hypothetical protein